MLLLEEVVKLSAREVKGEKSMEEMELKLRKLEEEKEMAGGSFDVPPPQQEQNVEALIDKEEGDMIKPPQQKQNVNADVDNENGEIIKDDVAGQTAINDEEGISKGSEAHNNIIPGVYSGEAAQKNIDTTNAVEEKTAEGSDESSVAAISASAKTNDQLFVPHNLNETTLMNIFAYADPLDVMNFAQTNKALISKVNIMFGMGSGEESDVDKQQKSGSDEDAASDKTEPPLSKEEIEAADRELAERLQNEENLAAASAETPNAETTNSAPSSPAKSSSPKLFGVPGPSHTRQGSSASAATAGSGGAANPFSQVSSWFGGTDASSTVSASTATTATVSADTGSEIKLNAAMATSMASKLTPAELSVILKMRERLQKCEADANKWKLEKEDAVAKLASVEAVKEFLVTRVRDTERVVQKQKEDMKAAQNKNLEDQEVIVFLDEKVKGLEKTADEMKSKEAATKQESVDVVNKNEKKSRVLSDMLRFEREQMASNEKEWKAAKKVLVKEVKSCRARIVALEAEVDGCRQQNTQLKQGLIALGSHSGRH